MKILFAGVFDKTSTNYSQKRCLESIGHTVIEFPWRSLPDANRSLEEITEPFDVFLISKGNGLKPSSILKFKKKTYAIIAYWFMDARCNYTRQLFDITQCSDVAFFDKYLLLDILDGKTTTKCFHVPEGFDGKFDKPHDVEKLYDASFIGSIYGARQNFTRMSNINLFNNVYCDKHAEVVSRSKININLCTDHCASDRVYKIMATAGFLLTDTWHGFEHTGFVDGKDLVLYNSFDDMQDKIKFYLKNEDLREQISKSGRTVVSSYERTNWAKRITEIIEK